MPVPTYSRIDDSEIDPESPITTSLMTRLRDNFLAVLGIDNDDPSPVMTLQPSALQVVEYGDSTTTSGTDSDTITASRLAAAVEEFRIGQFNAASSSDSTFPNLAAWSATIRDIHVVFSGGTPTGVFIRYYVGSRGSNTSSPSLGEHTYTAPLTNTFATMITGTASGYSLADLRVKAWADSTKVYLSFDFSGTGGGTVGSFSLSWNRYEFVNKAS